VVPLPLLQNADKRIVSSLLTRKADFSYLEFGAVFGLGEMAELV